MPDTSPDESTPSALLTPTEARLQARFEARLDALQSAERWDDEREQHEHLAAMRGQRRTLFLGGRGAYLGVEDDQLVVAEGRSDGVPGRREQLPRALHDIGTIIWVRSCGTMTVAALHWIRDEGIDFLALDESGRLLASSTPEPRYSLGVVELRRAQYRARENGADVRIARALLRRKLQAQRETLLRHPELPDDFARERALDAFHMALEWLDLEPQPDWLESPMKLMQFEARCSNAYWLAWRGLPLRWRASDTRHVPQHWLTIRERNSPLAPGKNARHAIDPCNAILNYVYGLLEGQTRAALLARGFDPLIGFSHADKPGRDSLVYDAMELRRAEVDDLVLRFLSGHTFQRSDVERKPDGSVLLSIGLARYMCLSCRVLDTTLRDDAEWLAGQVLEGA